MKKALTHLSLEATNAGKLARLDAVAIAYQCQAQAYVNVLIARGERMPDKYAPYPAGGYGLSERWLLCLAAGVRRRALLVQQWTHHSATPGGLVHPGQCQRVHARARPHDDI